MSENVDDIKIDWKETVYGSHVEELMKLVDLDETNIIS